MVIRTLCLGLGIGLLAGCSMDWPEPPPVSLDEFAADHREWRAARQTSLVRPGAGVVLWMGLWELAQGPTKFGSQPHLPISFATEDSPPLAGTLHRSGQEIRLEPAEGAPLYIREGRPVKSPMILHNDRSGKTTVLSLGSLGMRVHSEPGTDRLWLRVWDEDSPRRETFQLPEPFPVDLAWRVTARFEPYPEPRMMRVADVTEGTIEQRAPGELVFRADGQEHRLIAFAGANSRSYRVMMWDSTAVEHTYQAGRYLRVPLADEGGWTTIDFNRAYNPPCVFSVFSVCGLPPRENRLALAVTAGEMRPAQSAH